MTVKKIGPEHARALGRLEAEIYPPDFCLGWQDFLEDLEGAEREGANLSFGLFQESQLVGYIVAYIEDGVVFVSDLAVLSRNRAGLAQLLSAFFSAAAQTKLPIVAECRKGSYRVSLHPRFFSQFGYTLTHHQPVPPYNGEPSWEVRFDRMG